VIVLRVKSQSAKEESAISKVKQKLSKAGFGRKN
jgi:hypothetical protein